MSGSKVALVLGATGETGKEVVSQLVRCPTYNKILCLGRRIVDLPASGEGWEKVEQAVVDYDNLAESEDKFSGVDSAFCCLGTTRAKAGKEGFIKVDHDYVLSAAKLLQSSNCPDFHLLSSKGSNTSSWLLYTSTKGKVEEAAKQLNFPRLCIYRPGLLVCEREESRMGESCARWVAGMVDGTSMGWSVPTSVVAASMVATSLSPPSQGVEVMEHQDIVRVGREASE